MMLELTKVPLARISEQPRLSSLAGSTVKPSVSLLLHPLCSCLRVQPHCSACCLDTLHRGGALVRWTVDGSEVKKGVLTTVEEEKNGCYSRSSTLTLSIALLWKGGGVWLYSLPR
ncbi:hypothetical protein MHYP_G00170920 [Metynnis hypsauchen]